MTAPRKALAIVKTVFSVLLTALALGFTWGLVEALCNRYLPAVGTYRAAYLLGSINDRAVFYSAVSLPLFLVVYTSVRLLDRVFRPGSDTGVSFTTAFFAVAFAGTVSNVFFLFKSDRGGWHYLEVFANGLEPYVEDNVFPLLLIANVAGLATLPVFVAALGQRRWRGLVGTGYVVLATAGFAGLQAAEYVARASRPDAGHLPDVYVITMDACRADYFTPENVPRLTRYAAANCIVYKNAYAPASWTAPSFGALFTGQYPDACMVGGMALGTAQPTLAEVLYRSGYDTYFFTGNPVLDRPRGLHRGFEHHRLWSYSPLLSALRVYDTNMLNSATRDVNDLVPAGTVNRSVTAAALAIIRKESRRPKFAWFHYMDPHWPYHPVPRYVGVGYEKYAADGDFCFDAENLNPKNVSVLKELYRAEVRALDDELARVLEAIDASGPALIIITSDHGEEFYEHGAFDHGKSVYEEVVRVPLLIKAPGREPAVRGRPVSLINLAATVLTYVGLPVPQSMADGDLLGSGAAADEGPVFFGSWLYTDKYVYGAVTDDRKLILAAGDISAGTPGEYYDLKTDHRETNPLPYDATAESLSRAITGWKARNDALREAQDEGIMPKPSEADLRGLGYVD